MQDASQLQIFGSVSMMEGRLGLDPLTGGGGLNGR
jgi:hypothetical protein